MENNTPSPSPAPTPADPNNDPPVAPEVVPENAEAPETSCPSCAQASNATPPKPSYVYSLGRLEPRFPNKSIEKEFSQIAGRMNANGLPDRQLLRAVLTSPENRYLLRRICWIFSVQGLETYIGAPQDPADFALLADSLREEPDPGDLDLLIGAKGGLAPEWMCGGLILPIVAFDQVYSFHRNDLIASLPEADAKSSPTGKELLERMMQLTDNAGSSDEHRAINYLVVRYPAIYAAVATAYGNNESLTAVETHPSALSASRKIIEVVISFTHRQTDVVSKQFTRVDVTEEFPFLVTKLSPYFEH